MITEINDRKLVVISDLHLGNPFSKAKNATVEFFHWAAENGYDVVINGDGFEIAQVSFTKIARDVPEVFHAIKSYTNKGLSLYYVIGNHDIVLENFLNDWGGFKMAPFLNVRSGNLRVRIEHGHLYDPFFVKHPELYEFVTWIAGFALKMHPALYRGWIAFEKFKSKYFWKKSSEGIPGEHVAFREAAVELSARGFDCVVFGHTHHAGRAKLPGGASYFNTGSWLIGTPYIQVEDGRVELKRWSRGSQELVTSFTKSEKPLLCRGRFKKRHANDEIPARAG
ncbi:MAG: UDP-2,3-diacylglucosamine diphosphatase [Bdellovibrionota bacterium]